MSNVMPLDISNKPDLLRLAEEVRKTRMPKPLIKDNETVAVLMPASTTPKRKRSQRRGLTQADYEAFKATAGAWKDVDTDTLLANIYTDRKRSNRPPVKL